MNFDEISGSDGEGIADPGDIAQTLATSYLRRLVREKCSVPELHVILTIAAHGGAYRAVHESTISDDHDLLASLDHENPRQKIRETLLSCSQKGLITAHSTEGDALIVALAQDGKSELGMAHAGNLAEAEREERPTQLSSDTGPTVFALYEQNISLLTPLLADRITDALNMYPEPWIRDAIAEAVYYNRRSWRYIERILQNWATEGRGDETHRRNHERHHSAGTSLRDKVAPYLRRR